MRLYGRLSVRPAENRDYDPDGFAKIINDRIDPPRQLRGDDIFVRAMYLVSDQVNSFGGRFPADELDNLCEKIIDSPVLVGHNKSQLPIARNFMAEKTKRGDQIWVKVYFYWLRQAEGAETLARNIDGGVYREGSIGFIFSLPECSICGKDIRDCKHQPNQSYGDHDSPQVCHYNYRRIERVLETSLVYRGATPGTSFARELIARIPSESELRKSMQGDKSVEIRRRIVLATEKLPSLAKAYSRPLYFGMPVRVLSTGGRVTIRSLKHEIRLHDSNPLVRELDSLLDEDVIVHAQLFATRGKNRLPLHLYKDNAKLTGRCELVIENITDLNGNPLASDKLPAYTRRIASADNLKLAPVRIHRGQIVPGDLSQNKFGSQIFCFADGRCTELIQYRSGSHLLLKARDVVLTKTGRHKYRVDLSAGGNLRNFWTGETSIKANPGETLLIKLQDNGASSQVFKVVDNLGQYYPADAPERLSMKSAGREKFVIERNGNVTALSFSGNDLDLTLVIPHFNPLALSRGKTLIGYPLRGKKRKLWPSDKSRKQSNHESGLYQVRSSRDDFSTIEMSSATISGTFSLRPASWNKHRLMLLSCLSDECRSAISTSSDRN